MTALRNFPDAPMRQLAAEPWHWQTPAWMLSVWQALEDYGQSRAAWELERLAVHRQVSDPALAQQFLDAAAECRRAAGKTSARSGS